MYPSLSQLEAEAHVRWCHQPTLQPDEQIYLAGLSYTGRGLLPTHYAMWAWTIYTSKTTRIFPCINNQKELSGGGEEKKKKKLSQEIKSCFLIQLLLWENSDELNIVFKI